MSYSDLIGKQFGRLTVRGEAPRRSNYPRARLWLCDCSCGNTTTALAWYLRKGIRKSCGCIGKEPRCKGWKGCGELSGYAWSSIRSRARSASIPLTITIEEAWALFLKQGRRCALTGVSLAFAAYAKDKAHQTASLDRIDSSKGYDPGNVQWVHKTINFMKHSLSQEAFVMWCSLVAASQKKCLTNSTLSVA